MFYYDIVCPYTYLAAHRILGLTKHPGAAHVEVQWKPVLLGALYKVLSRQPPISQPRGGNLAVVDLSTVAFSWSCIHRRPMLRKARTAPRRM